YTRGKERSRLKEDILSEIDDLVQKDFKEITLLGQNVNAYGKDLGVTFDFADLLESVAQKDIPRVRFMTSHPWDFTDKLIKVIAKYKNVMPFIHLPLQSGNNEILKIMGRRYTKEIINLKLAFHILRYRQISSLVFLMKLKVSFVKHLT
ncbi:MAG: bifunctional enzyme involved in thiolation and methylation of tRNA, partial [Erysipelotrichaceae bacterium]